MKLYTTTRRPKDKRNGGVSRAWLLKQLPAAKYPNLLLLVALGALPPAVVALRSNISEDVLIDGILGEDGFTMAEARRIINAVSHEDLPSFDFVFSSDIAYVKSGEGCPDWHREGRKMTGRLPIPHAAIPLLRKFWKQERIPQAVMDCAEAVRDFCGEYGQEYGPRIYPLPPDDEE